MCGFIGSVSDKKYNRSHIYKANALIECRGPDETKEVFEKASKIFNTSSELNLQIIFNRLSIIDLSENASQPMFSSETNTGIIFNGEIFNHKSLRKNLEKKYQFKSSHSDTEVLLYGLTEYGTDFLKKLNGQFAIVFFDFNISKIYLIRDRLGQKPLYYYYKNDELFFSSNFISLAKLTNSTSLSVKYVNQYLDLGVVPSPNTILENIFKVKAAEILEFTIKNSLKLTKKEIYWKISDYLGEKNFDYDEFIHLFEDAVNIRKESDVPISYFLSGGLDSTSIIKSATKNEDPRSVNTFSIKSEDIDYDESKFSNIVASKFSTNHTEFSVNSNLDESTIYDVVSAYDEIYFDPSVIPTFILSKEISKNYKVAISGDGGDELLGGYSRTKKILKDNGKFNNIFSNLYKIYPPSFGTGNRFLINSNQWETRYLSFYEDKKLMNLINVDNDIDFFEIYKKNKAKSNLKNIQMLDYNFYLSEMMLYKIDRASMKNSLEIRSPFVDNRLIEYIFSHSQEYFYNDKTKYILQNYLKNDFDSNFLNRKKQGFVVNTSSWVFNNLDIIDSTFNNGNFIYEMDKNIVKKLSRVKSRINGLRLWKLYFLEVYFQLNKL